MRSLDRPEQGLARLLVPWRIAQIPWGFSYPTLEGGRPYLIGIVEGEESGDSSRGMLGIGGGKSPLFSSCF